ncbi:MAG: FG-GAP-like repeat-containing protein [Chloroflexi bacterium]|nr:FG-GAP-like repeat-containing protein [Chloroflexota bacterium]
MRNLSTFYISRNWRLLIPILLPLFTLLLWPTLLFAQDNKSGVKPQVISLPSGPGSLEGLGENFEPNLSTGTASYPVKFTAAPGRVGFQPDLSLNYNGGNANGPWGMGWELSIPSIQRRTEEGLPSYDDTKDTFIYTNGEKMVALKDSSYRFENEGSFMRFRRLESGGWEAQSPDGLRYRFGETENARVANPRGIFRWELERVIDTHGNEMQYIYLHDGDYAYPREIRYNFGENQGGGAVYNAVIFNYAPRPDTYTDRRSGAPIRVGLRGTDIQMWATGKLVRAYAFTYEPERSTGKYSLLVKVEQVGDDGVSKLPPQTFTYTQFDAAAHAVVTMQNPPPVALTNPDVDLVDINADGLPDLVYTPESGQHRFYLNRGHGRWQTEPVLPQNSPAERLSTPNVRMADMNGDGAVDLLVKASGTGAPLYYYSNKQGAEWQQSGRVDFGPAPAFDLNDPNLQLLDVNNDHRIDVVLTAGGRLKIWLAKEGAWSQTADFDVPAPAAGDTANFADPKFKIGDMTGDRMDDVVMVRDGQVVLWAHNGNGSYEEPRPILNPPSGVGAQDVLIQMGDLNNDGQMDLVLPGNRSVTYWLSLGDGSLTDPITIPDTPAFDVQTTAVRLADIDGDGATELLFSSQNGMEYVDFSTQEQPFLLRSVDNGLGRTIQITYKSSIEDYIADWDANNPWQVNLPFPVQVVNKTTVHDANSGDDYTINYHYRDGYYDGVQKEFRGFVRSQETKIGDATAATTVMNLVYDVGMSDESHKGLLLESEVLAQDGHCTGDYAGCFQRTVNQLETRTVVTVDQTATGQPIAYAFVKQTDSFVHEQQAQPVQLRQTFAQDNYGNQTQAFNYGQVCGEDVTCGADELLTYTDYIYDESRYRFDRPLRIYQTDAAGTVVSDKRLYYDGDPYVGLPTGQLTRGDLTRQEESLGSNGAGRFIPTQRQQFDAFGNAIGIMDANGKVITVEYDALMHTFPVVERMHLDDGKALVFAASYHYGFGKVSAATDYNGHAITYAYDTFGRLSKIVQPGDSLAQPTQQFRYEIGSPRSAIISEQREQSGTDQVYTTVTYFDGLGRKLQTRSEAEAGQVVVTGASIFNARQTVGVEYLPYYDSDLAYKAPGATLPHITQYYDPLARIERRQQPDGAFTRVVYQPLRQLLYDEEDNNPSSPHYDTPRTLSFDGLERLIAVEEVNRVNNGVERYVTHYEYDRLNRLLKIVDAQGHVKTQTFDALGRKLSITDPDRGPAFFTYDDKGNVIETVDAKGQHIRYTYDPANRILTQNYVASEGDVTPEVRYHYDADLALDYADAQNTQGRLAWVEDEAGGEYLSYDARGDITGRVRRITQPNRGEQIDFAMRMAYDAMQRLVKFTYPDGVVQHFAYNEQSYLEAAPGYVNNIDYMPLGKRTRIETADGASTAYDYDTRQRLATLRTVGQQNAVYQDWRYQLDGVGNILRIDDLRADKTISDDASERFTYDSLNRLTTAQYADGNSITYGYDPVGNLVRKNSSLPEENLGDFQVGQTAGPHALTQVSGDAWRYDANGSLIERGPAGRGFAYTWDAHNRLREVNGAAGLHQLNSYNYADQRMVKVVDNGGQTEVALYPDRSFEVRDNEVVKYIFANDERIAEVRTPFDKNRLIRGLQGDVTPQTDNPAQTKTLFYHGDHLGSATVLVDPTGQVVERQTYQPFGESRAPSSAQVADYSYTGNELDEGIGLYYYGARYYDPSVGRFISVDPLYFEQPEKDLADPQALNLYSYVRNNPMRNIDPTGEDVLIAYSVGHGEDHHKAVAIAMAADLRKQNLKVYVVKAPELRTEQKQAELAKLNISAAIFVGHGNRGMVGFSNESKGGFIVADKKTSPEEFAEMAGVKKGGVVGFLACNVVSGYTSSEETLAKRGISAIGFNRDIFSRTDGMVQSPDRRVNLNSTQGYFSNQQVGNQGTDWFQPGAIQPAVQTGPNAIENGTFGDYVNKAEERTKPKK